MKTVESPPPSLPHARRRWARLSTLAFLLGLIAALLIVHALPPAPPFSPQLGRATYWQSYETSYFASVRAYEELLRSTLAAGNIPIVVFGDSTLRGTGAVGADVWTRLLEQRLQTADPRVRVLNYSQNAGDLMGPFLFHHLQKKFPDAYYINQWHFSSEVGVRHPFHYWLTAEIALRDGNANPAVKHSFHIVPVKTPEERYAFVLAGANIAINYLDVGNWIRYRWMGRPFFDSDRKVKVQPLRDVAEADVTTTRFTPPAAASAQTMREVFRANVDAWVAYVKRPLAERAAYFAEMYPPALRSHMLLLTLDFNPYYAPRDEIKAMAWRTSWVQLRADMRQISDLRWVSLAPSQGEMQQDDFSDLGHLTVHGQQLLADAVADNLLSPGGWFGPKIAIAK